MQICCEKYSKTKIKSKTIKILISHAEIKKIKVSKLIFGSIKNIKVMLQSFVLKRRSFFFVIIFKRKESGTFYFYINSGVLQLCWSLEILGFLFL